MTEEYWAFEVDLSGTADIADTARVLVDGSLTEAEARQRCIAHYQVKGDRVLGPERMTEATYWARNQYLVNGGKATSRGL